MKMRGVIAGVVIAVSAIVVARAPTVKVTKDAPTSQRKPFSEIPPEQAKLAVGHSAYTYCYYSATWYYHYDTFPQRASGGRTRMQINMRNIDLKLKLDTTTWLAPDAPQWLVEHEQGHRAIGEFSYQKADSIARTIAQKMIGKTYEGEGPDEDSAETAARNKAGDEWLADYLHSVSDTTQHVHDLYDKITNHGLRHEIPVDVGVQRAIEQYRAEKQRQSASQPAE
jgi:hypothetical protein